MILALVRDLRPSDISYSDARGILKTCSRSDKTAHFNDKNPRILHCAKFAIIWWDQLWHKPIVMSLQGMVGCHIILDELLPWKPWIWCLPTAPGKFHYIHLPQCTLDIIQNIVVHWRLMTESGIIYSRKFTVDANHNMRRSVFIVYIEVGCW